MEVVFVIIGVITGSVVVNVVFVVVNSSLAEVEGDVLYDFDLFGPFDDNDNIILQCTSFLAFVEINTGIGEVSMSSS